MSTILYFKASDEGVTNGQRTINMVTTDSISTVSAAGWGNTNLLELVDCTVISF